ncbi:MAG TPA: pentapeptide repeat-containing protein, partial [Candidatus Contendobacter sp.]|nr:pentapeptide repeat-containing protein [Candidatus Contendobacter sp.]
MQRPDEQPSWQTLESRLAKLKPAQRALAQSFIDQARRSATGHVPLTALLQSHFGDKAGSSALTNLRQIRKRLNEELAALGAGIELVVDESGTLETRACYLRAPADKGAEVESLADALNYDRDRGKHVAPKARPLNEPITVEIPISYSHVNKKLVRELHERLQKVLDARPSKTKYLLRRDERDTELSDTLDPQIAALFEDGVIALFMLSVDFFNSNYCQKREVPKFIDAKGKNRSGKRAICVPVALEHQHLKTVPEKFKQRVIAFHEGPDERPKSWRELCQERFESEKEAFLHRIAGEIIKAADALAGPDDTPPDGGPPSGRRTKKLCTDEAIHEFAGFIPREIDPNQYTRQRAKHLGTLDRKNEDGLAASADETGVELIPALIEWAKDQAAPPFCALLGEYGVGKTVSCQMLAARINAERKQPGADTLPLALYFDLRRVDAQRLSDFAVEPIIEQLLTSADQAHQIKARALIDWVRAHSALVIFDGLDEVLVHLDPKRGRDFTRALWSIYPLSHWERRAADPASTPAVASATRPNVASKLLMSCRSHYFRTIADERALFVGQDREAIRASDYRAYLILPFNPEQIIDYLKRNFPQRDPAQTFELIAGIHNLKELAQRPVLLSHIGNELAELEQRKIAGQAVNTAVLYGLFVERWLRRDDSKHQLSLPHKRVLMEHLAAELTRRGVRELAYDRIEEWLDRFIAARPDWESVYRAKDREILKEDLRTATFIVRPDEKKFRFAHTSLHEYFLAGYLLHTLMAGEADGYRLPPPSPETCTFFAERWQMAATEGDDRLPDAQRTLVALLEQAAPGRSETAFAAWLALHRLGLPPLRPARFDLRGCDLREWTVDGGEQGLTLGAVDFSDADLMHSRWRRVRLPGARLDRANAADSEWHEVGLEHATADGADLDGAIFRHSRLVNVDFRSAEHSGAHYLLCERTGAQLPPTPPHRIAPGADLAAVAMPWRPQPLTGHRGAVWACGFSADGRWLASGGDDGTLRLWDVAGRREAHRFTGHDGGVWACGFSADGRWLASGGDDGTLRLWDVAGRREAHRFTG